MCTCVQAPLEKMLGAWCRFLSHSTKQRQAMPQAALLLNWNTGAREQRLTASGMAGFAVGGPVLAPVLLKSGSLGCTVSRQQAASAGGACLPAASLRQSPVRRRGGGCARGTAWLAEEATGSRFTWCLQK